MQMHKKRRGRPTTQLQKLESLGILASGIAHDLNNILTGILGHVTCLRYSLPEQGPHRDSLHAIEDGARRAAAMSQQILGFVRDEERSHGPINLQFVVQAAVNLLRGALPPKISIEVNSDGNESLVVGDESQLGQLVMNLLVNARDALPEGGQISVYVGNRKVMQRELLSHGELEPGNYTVLSVSDNGVGIAPDVRERMFEPFFTTKLAQGTGLGLATVFSTVETHRGTIEVHSELGKGSCFDVYFPLPEIAPSEDKIPRGSECILVVDDEETVLTSIQRSLEHLGYQVDVARSGDEAIACYQGAGRSYNLVILDMMMPQMSGDELYWKLREIDSQVRVLIASGYSSERRTKKILESGGRGFIQKPFAVEELAREVRRCLDP